MSHGKLSDLPASFLFRYRFAVPRVSQLPERWPERPEGWLPNPADLDRSAPLPARLWAGWNERGCGFLFRVTDKQHPPGGDAHQLEQADRCRLWIDTRCTQNVHRATQYCHALVAYPQVTEGSRRRPLLQQVSIPQARGDAPRRAARLAEIRFAPERNGYRLLIWLPAEALHGFDPEQQREIGFFWLVRDSELGLSLPAYDTDVPFVRDPSVWFVAQLADESP
ncbi:MAG: hypothetical protein D6725_09435 [Planctomycetota bacterium]|nr:MAG: hypothetical protein D6725_09435 [Planctomycetota bacterium]